MARWTLDGMTALVTGGTRGIGKAIVEELAALGASVHTCCRTKAELDERLREWEVKGFRVTGTVCDLSSLVEREKLMSAVSVAFSGKLSILVNNAAVAVFKDVLAHTVQDCSRVMSANYEAAFHLAQLAHPLLKESGYGSIIFISSIASLIALPYMSVYSASKGAINLLAKNLACEWAKDNIRTNAVAAWAVKTTLQPPADMLPHLTGILARSPIPRMAEPQEVSSVVAFLCLPAASYINGHVLSVDGGFSVSAF